jgi:hypothetical protein
MSARFFAIIGAVAYLLPATLQWGVRVALSCAILLVVPRALGMACTLGFKWAGVPARVRSVGLGSLTGLVYTASDGDVIVVGEMRMRTRISERMKSFGLVPHWFECVAEDVTYTALRGAPGGDPSGGGCARAGTWHVHTCVCGCLFVMGTGQG